MQASCFLLQLLAFVHKEQTQALNASYVEHNGSLGDQMLLSYGPLCFSPL